MQRVHVVTKKSFTTSEYEIVGIYGELLTAMNMARTAFFQLCIAEDIPLEQQECSPQTFIAKKSGLTIATIEVEHHTVVSEDFPVVSMTREDLMSKGFDADDLEDDEMEKIASKACDYLLDGDYWVALNEAADFYDVPQRKEE